MTPAALGPQTKTARGFRLVEFKDKYGVACSIQQSSLADSRCLWIGPNDPNPRILATQAAAHGVKTSETCGWVKFPLSENVLCDTRMHIDEQQVRALIKHLRSWLKSGEFQ